MNARLIKWKEQFEAVSLRERALVVLAVLAASWMLWSISLGSYQNAEITRLEREVTLRQQQISDEVAVQQVLRSRMQSEPGRGLEDQRSRLQRELALVQQELKTLIGRFVDPALMPALLEDVLTRHDGVTLLQVSALPVAPMLLDADDPNSSVPGLYRHGMRLQIAGRYFDVLDYLGELEVSDWQFIWQELDYEVTQYPTAQVWIELETLSQKKNWMDV